MGGIRLETDPEQRPMAARSTVVTDPISQKSAPSAGKLPFGGAILITTWVLLAVAVVTTTVSIKEHLQQVSALDETARSADLPTSVYVPGNIDGRAWFRHAEAVLDGKAFRIRHTDIDNAPAGRDVHWSSGWTWIIAGSGWLWHVATGEPKHEALEHATVWLPSVMLLVLMVAISGYAARRAGWLAGVLVAVAMVGHNNFYKQFIPTYLDHHGLIVSSVFAMTLGALFMGAGWWTDGEDENGQRATGNVLRILPSSKRDAHRAAIVSGICGGIGLWISAASVVPVIALIGVAGIAAGVFARQQGEREGLHFESSVWRTWGRVGAATSVFFYLVEYFPNHLGFRLEVNHPLYALAWLGAGELIAEIVERARTPRSEWFAQPARLARPAFLIALAPITILVAGVKVFWLLDPFLATIHPTYIREFSPGWPGFAHLGIENLPLGAAIVFLIARREKTPALVWFATIVALGCTLAGWRQARWLDVASGAQIALALVLATHLAIKQSERTRITLALSAFGVMFLPTTITGVADTQRVTAEGRVEGPEALLVLYRDVASALRASSPDSNITILSTPTVSPHVAYFGQFQSVGTFYWENEAGLKAAAAILSSQSDDEAKQEIRARHITHIALFTHDDFLTPYYRLLHRDAGDSDVEHTFGARLLHRGQAPQWLQWIPYRAPGDLTGLETRVLLFKVNFDQTAAEFLTHAARAKMAMGEYASADRDIDSLIALSPKEFMPRVLKGQSLFARREWSQAADAAAAAMNRAPEVERLNIGRSVGANFLAADQKPLAFRIFRSTLQQKFDADIACTLAYALSTAREDSLRNGREALTLAERAFESDTLNSKYAICYGAALAENGRFGEAERSVERVTSGQPERADAQAVGLARELIEAFKARTAWRDGPR